MERIFVSTVKEDEGPFRSLRSDDEGNLSVAPPSSGLPFQFFLTANGLGTGNHNLNGNYTSPTEFLYTSTSRYEIYSVLVSISDGSSFNQTDYGAIIGGLTNGIKFFVKVGEVYIPLLGTGEYPIKTNYEWLSISPETELTSFAGLAQTLSINFNIINQYGKPLSLGIGQSFVVRLNDNLSGLVNHTFGLRGILY